MRKFWVFLILLGISFSGFSYAMNEFNYNSALQLANDYIKNSSFDENWKDHNPQIQEKGKEFYTDDESNISYIEFKVSCDITPDCGFIMVNFDGDDVSIPVASTSGNTPSEILLAQNGGNIEDNKLYYFSPFGMYGENTKTQEVSSIDPIDNIDQVLEQDKKLTKEEKQEKRKASKLALKNKIKSLKKEAKDYKKTDDFKNKRQELKDKKQTIPKDNEISYKILPFAEYANADDPQFNQNGYTPVIASDKFVPGNAISNTCGSRIPCYKQFSTIYNGNSCSVGCTPVAVGMIFGYHDRQGIYPNLVSGTASGANDTNVNTMIKALGDKMKTYCSGTSGATSSSNYINSIQYAKDKGYKNSVATFISGNSSTLFSTIKTEINAERPVMLNTDNHSVVVYGYNKNFTTANIIRVNLGWGYRSISGIDGKIYYLSNIDYNINYIYYNSANHSPKSIVTFKLIN